MHRLSSHTFRTESKVFILQRFRSPVAFSVTLGFLDATTLTNTEFCRIKLIKITLFFLYRLDPVQFL